MIIDKTKGDWLHSLLTNNIEDIVYQLYLNDFYNNQRNLKYNILPFSQSLILYEANNCYNEKYVKYCHEAKKIIRKQKLEKICLKSEIL